MRAIRGIPRLLLLAGAASALGTTGAGMDQRAGACLAELERRG
jgi:hypothetical protein